MSNSIEMIVNGEFPETIDELENIGRLLLRVNAKGRQVLSVVIAKAQRLFGDDAKLHL